MSSPASTQSLHDSLFDYDPEPLPKAILTQQGAGFFDLPAEIRSSIYSLVFDADACYDAAIPSQPAELDLSYHASSALLPLLTSRQFYAEAHLLAFSRILFVVSNPYLALDIGNHMAARLRPSSLAAIRHLAFVADNRHFRSLRSWREDPFRLPGLHLDRLSIILHRSSYWHYLFDYNAVLVELLRRLRGVDELVFIRNNAHVKGTLLTWYNRLVLLMLKTDRMEVVEKRQDGGKWWRWGICHEREMVSFRLKDVARTGLTAEAYDALMVPLYKELAESMEQEEEDPDPMSRTSA